MNITPNNNLSVLPFYNEKARQNHRKNYAYGLVYPLITPIGKLPPFQIRRESRSNTFTNIVLKKVDESVVGDITQDMNDGGITIKQFPSYGYDIIVYHGIFPLSTPVEEGQHYMTLSDGVETWTSDMFTFVASTEGFLKIQWWDINNLHYEGGHIDYSGLFKNTLYLCTELGKPEYKFEEEGEERDGFFFPEKQISEKVFKFTFLAPEYLCDVMRIIRLSDFVEITSLGLLYKIDTFQMEPKWQTQGDLAAVEVEFECDTVVKKLGSGGMVTNTTGCEGEYSTFVERQEPESGDLYIEIQGNLSFNSIILTEFVFEIRQGTNVLYSSNFNSGAEQTMVLRYTIPKEAYPIIAANQNGGLDYSIKHLNPDFEFTYLMSDIAGYTSFLYPNEGIITRSTGGLVMPPPAGTNTCLIRTEMNILLVVLTITVPPYSDIDKRITIVWEGQGGLEGYVSGQDFFAFGGWENTIKWLSKDLVNDNIRINVFDSETPPENYTFTDVELVSATATWEVNGSELMINSIYSDSQLTFNVEAY